MSKAEDWASELKRLRDLAVNTSRKVGGHKESRPHFLGNIDTSFNLLTVAEVDDNGDLELPASRSRITRSRIPLFVKWLEDTYGPFEENER